MNTRRTYEWAWRSWQGWCRRIGTAPLPAEPRLLVIWISTTKWSLPKVRLAIAAISRAHRLAGHVPPPTSHVLVRDAFEVLCRRLGTAPKNAKAAVTLGELRTLTRQIDRTTLAGKRDAALLLLTWWSARRRSEIVALDRADVAESPGGIAIVVKRSKTDQHGEGMPIGLPKVSGDLCPVAALDAWFTASGVTSGPIFRGLTRHGGVRRRALRGQEVARLVKRLAAAAGLDPKHFGGHSLRAGFITEAFRQDVSEAQIMATSGHRSTVMLARYRREADPVRRSAGSKIKV